MTPELVHAPEPGSRRADKESMIVAAAAEEFRSVGFAAARLDAIAARAGVAKGTIYLYFDTKEDLFKASVRRLVHPLIEEIERDVSDYQGTTAELLTLAIRALYRNMVEREDTRELMRLMMAEGSRIPEMSEFFTKEVLARGCATFRMILWRGMAQGEFRKTPAADFPELIIAGAKAAAMSILMFGPAAREADPAYQDAHIRYVLDALQVTPPG